jgi:hypothetical protein
MTKRKLFRKRSSAASDDASNDDAHTKSGSDSPPPLSVRLEESTSEGGMKGSWWSWKSFYHKEDNSLTEADLFGDTSDNLSNQIHSTTPTVMPPQTTSSRLSSAVPTSLSSFSNTSSTRSSRSSSFSSNSVPFQEPSSWSSFFSSFPETLLAYYRLRYLEGDNDLYYTLRTQPFSSSIYLRGMLIAGFSNTLFHLYDFFLLAPSSLASSASSSPVTLFPSFYHLTVYRLTFTFLILHIFLNLLSIPTRVLLHYQCWRNSRVFDSESASIALQDLLSSNIWVFNRILAWSLDTISLTTLVCGQLYLWNDSPSSSLASTTPSCPYLTTLIENLCATDILSFLIRSLVGAMYLLSFREFRDGSGVRNRGMSNFDLDRLQTFPFPSSPPTPAAASEPSSSTLSSTESECSICLQAYEKNDLLLRLPCHERHCFHVDCIREWLKRQNACPLCQKMC